MAVLVQLDRAWGAAYRFDTRVVGLRKNPAFPTRLIFV